LWQISISQAQWIGDSVNESHIHKGIQYVYNLSFDSAKAEFQFVTHSKPDHPAGHFFLAMVEWWKIITDINNKSRDDNFIAMLDRVIDLCDTRLDQDENDITSLFFKGGALGFQGRLYGNREDWLKAANCGRAALPIIMKAYKLEPNNYDVLLGIGIYNYYAAVIPDIYPWVKPLMLFVPKGDKIKGITQLRTASEQAQYANIEATYVLLQVLQNFENQSLDAQQLALKLHKLFPNNVIFHKYVGRCFAALGQWNELEKTYLEILRRVKAKQLGYDTNIEREADYYIGIVQMNYGKYDSALQYFYLSDELSRTLDVNGNSGFMVLTNLKIGMIYDIQGKRALAVEQYKKVLDMKDNQNAHKEAEEFLKTPYKNS
jgi:tetratricopeptide (TPR) repeat protein